MNISLPLKYRPERFEDLVGQDINVKFLSALIQKGQIGKNIILYGAYGSSKTTSCRIYARALNCLNPTINGSPCNSCENCKHFYENRYSDYLEIDGSSKGGKESIKELVQVAKTPPLMGKYRIINIDECQGLSKQAWDNLLKLIEEPPPYLVFIFTTTERDKVREAIRSRCQELEVKLLDHNSSKKHLIKICDLEHIKYEDDALELLAYLSGGHARDILKNMEQVTYLGDITLENVRQMFNLGYIEGVYSYFKNLVGGDMEGYIKSTSKLMAESYNADQIYKFFQEFMLYFYYNIVIGIGVTVEPILAAIPHDDYKKIYNHLNSITSEKGISIESASELIVDIFAQNKVKNKTELDLFSIGLFNFIHKSNFKSGNFSKEINGGYKGEVKGGKSGTNRRFVGSYSREVRQEEIKTTQQDNTGTIYVHNLMQHNFKQLDKSTNKIIIL